MAIKFRPKTTFLGRLLSHETESHKKRKRKRKQIWGNRYNWKEVASHLLQALCVDQQMALDSYSFLCSCVFVLWQVMSQWRAHVFHSKQPVKVGNKHYIMRSCIRAHRSQTRARAIHDILLQFFMSIGLLCEWKHVVIKDFNVAHTHTYQMISTPLSYTFYYYFFKLMHTFSLQWPQKASGHSSHT